MEGFETLVTILESRRWPGVEVGESWGTEALKCRGKMLVRMREPDILVIPAQIEEKAFLKEMDPETFFETDHYRNSNYILCRVSKIDPEYLAERLENAWRGMATKKMIGEYEARVRD